MLTRAIRTAWLALAAAGQLWIPEDKDWRLNERHYGGLTGLNKAETAARHGDGAGAHLAPLLRRAAAAAGARRRVRLLQGPPLRRRDAAGDREPEDHARSGAALLGRPAAALDRRAKSDAITTAALVGTARGVGQTVTGTSVDTLSCPGGSTERDLLLRAGALAVYRAAGYMPSAAPEMRLPRQRRQGQNAHPASRR